MRYSLPLDCMGLSARNGWLDDRKHVFIYFTFEDAMAVMGFMAFIHITAIAILSK